MPAIVGLSMATTLSLSMLTACDDDDDDLTETVDEDDDVDSSSDIDSEDDTDSNSTTAGTAVDLGLSVKWATVNIGATLPADYGNYYAWGETETKDEYTSDNSVTYNVSFTFGDISGRAKYDAATANWGGTWRMPTYIEMQELIDDCTWTYTTQGNSDGEEINGYLVESTNGNSIFLPATGSSLGNVGTKGTYWSSTSRAYDILYAYGLYFDSSSLYVGRYGSRYYGRSVRPVSE